jgi:hypothetical protein
MPTAVLIDGGYFQKRYPHCYGKKHPANEMAGNLHKMCLEHLKDSKDGYGRRLLYRIFYYDCPPMTHKVTHPLTQKSLNFADTPQARFRVSARANRGELHRDGRGVCVAQGCVPGRSGVCVAA